MQQDSDRVRGANHWSQAVDMSPAEIDDLLSGRWIVRFGTIGRDGYPNITPMWYYWDGKCFYIPSYRTRLAVKNLERDPRCFAIVDIDLRPQMGLRINFAKAVMIKGDATLLDHDAIGRETVGTWFESGPLHRPMTLAEASAGLVARYRLQDRDGALGRIIRNPPPSDSNGPQSIQAVIIKIVPKSVRGWDFSKGPFDYLPEDA
jgi:nitroimidazol reductase NimA-like FMN-containing flavoprotein (pyridoxamine 5'-phosphate oxidase superfamily)